MFLDVSSDGEVMSFETDLEEVNPTPVDQAIVPLGQTVKIYLLSLSQSPCMYSLTFQNSVMSQASGFILAALLGLTL